MYIENPKTRGSGIICCIPQTGKCPNECPDCFFQSGRSYLEPLEINLPNVPSKDDSIDKIIRINDGNDSNVNRNQVEQATFHFSNAFFNTAIPNSLEEFPRPVVLTINPGSLTDKFYHILGKVPLNLMFVRFRTNTWNLDLCDSAVEYYSGKEVPIILTFMAYFNYATSIPSQDLNNYIFRKRTLNSYYAITTEAWRKVMARYQDNKWVYSCGKIEGEKGDTHCRFCGNCLREYFVTLTRLGVNHGTN